MNSVISKCLRAHEGNSVRVGEIGQGSQRMERKGGKEESERWVHVRQRLWGMQYVFNILNILERK